MTRTYYIVPVPKPRMTQRDKWAKRPCVLRYRAFCDRVRFARVKLPEPCRVIFHLPMPASWSKAKREKFDGQAHRQKPDLDNLLKALIDAVYREDAHLAFICAEKRWALEGAIEVIPLTAREALVGTLEAA